MNLQKALENRTTHSFLLVPLIGFWLQELLGLSSILNQKVSSSLSCSLALSTPFWIRGFFNLSFWIHVFVCLSSPFGGLGWLTKIRTTITTSLHKTIFLPFFPFHIPTFSSALLIFLWEHFLQSLFIFAVDCMSTCFLCTSHPGIKRYQSGREE